LSSNETFPYYFRELLPQYSVKNFGFHGYGVHEALAILETASLLKISKDRLLINNYRNEFSLD